MAKTVIRAGKEIPKLTLRKRKPKAKKPGKRVVKRTLKSLKLQADILWSKLVKEIDGHKCVYCGAKANLNSHHIFTKKRHANMRWMLDNGITLCPKCHIFGVHQDPAKYLPLIIKYCGPDRWERLTRAASKPAAPIRIPNVEQALNSLTEASQPKEYASMAV